MPLLIKTKSTRIGDSDMVSLEFFFGTTDKLVGPFDVEPLRQAGKLILTLKEWEYVMNLEPSFNEAFPVIVDDGVDEVLESFTNKPIQKA